MICIDLCFFFSNSETCVYEGHEQIMAVKDSILSQMSEA